MKPITDITYWQHRLELIVVLIVLTITATILIGLLLRLILQLLSWRKLISRTMISLELTPPAFTARSAQATAELFNIIAGLKNSRPLKDRLLLRQISMPFEITSSEGGGISFISRIDKRYAASVAQNVMSYLPEVKVAEVPNETSLPDNARVVEFKQTGEWFLPFAQHENLEQHDPMAYLAGVMTKLQSADVIGYQLIITPAKIRHAKTIAFKALRNDDVLSSASRRSTVWPKIAYGVNSFLFGLLDIIGDIYHTPSQNNYSSAQRNNYEQIQIAKGIRPTRTLSKLEQERNDAIHHKVGQQLFYVSIRVMVALDTPEATNARLAAIKSSLSSYSVPSYQGLQPRLQVPFINRYRRFTYQHGLPSLLKRHSCILSSTEIASLYHFPIGEEHTKVDNLNASLSRTLPAPISLKQHNTLDVIIGRNHHHGVNTDIGLSTAERERHMYIIGGTGNGKTTMLQYVAAQDMRQGKGLAIIDPHGDMAETLLRQVPKERINDVVYFNPDDIMYPIGLNLLELPEGVTGDEMVREKDLITESVISVFRKIFSEEDTGGHRIEYVLRNAIQTALTIEDATLFTVFDLLNDPTYRKGIIKQLENKDLINFWKNELGKAGEMQKVKMSAGITAKIGRFLFSASAKRILEQPKSTIDFDDIINSGKILICNLSKGLLGEDTSELFGVTVLAKLQLASLRRARIQQTDRLPFYLYVDEFQNFATASFVQMLSESRKYKLFMIMAEQSTSQQKDQQMVSVILANVGTVICFRTGNPADERLMLPLFSPFINEGEIANLPTFNFYAKLSAINVQEPLSGQTLLLENEGNSMVAQTVIALSREKFTRKPESKQAKERPALIKKPMPRPQKSKKKPEKQTASAGMLDKN